LDQGFPREIQMVEALGCISQIEKRLRIHWQAARGLPQHLLGTLWPAGQKKGTTVQRHRVPRGGWPRRDGFERLKGFAEGGGVATLLSGFEPNAAQCKIDIRLIRQALGGTAQRHHGHIRVIPVRITKAQRDVSLDSRGVKYGERFKLLHLFLMPALTGIQVGQLFARWCHCGLQRDGALECLNGFEVPIQIAQAQAQKVMRLGETFVDSDGLP
jgi:hypothetical protein